jgi:response regulator of citrate/malate metabolism
MDVCTKKVLIAEDDLAQKSLWESFFSNAKNKIELHWTVSCEEALKLIQKSQIENNPFDLIITDIFLAGSGTGMDLLNSEIVEKCKAKKVLVSAVEREDVLEKFGHLLTDIEIMSKPISREKYESVMTRILNS